MADLVGQLRPIAAEPARGPEIQDLLRTEVQTLIGRLGGDEYAEGTSFSAEELARRVTSYQAACDQVCRAFALLGYWGSVQLAGYCSDLISAVASARDRANGIRVWLQLYAYPAQLLFYAFGLGALHAGRVDNLGRLFHGRLQDHRGEWLPAVLELHNQGPLDADVAKALPEMERHRTPSSDWLWQVLSPLVADLAPSEVRREWDFDRFEVLVGLAYLGSDQRRGGRWAPGGRFTWRSAYSDAGAAAETLAEIESAPQSSPLVGPIFASATDLTEAAKRYRTLFALHSKPD